MGFLGRLKSWFTSPVQAMEEEGRAVRARGHYEAADAGGMNANHWIGVNGMDANACNSLAVRRTLSRRVRKEEDNNGQGKGIVLTHANYVVGRGPKIRVQTGSTGFNRMIEAAWNTWAARVKLARKLRTSAKAKVRDGESFLVAGVNPRLRHKVKLDVRGIECEQCTTPTLGMGTLNRVDGIEFDEWGNPTFYDILQQHPGSVWGSLEQAPERVPAKFVYHLFREDRHGQQRAVPELTPSLNLFACHRRFREATIVAAENIAMTSLVLKTVAPMGAEPPAVAAMSTLPFEKGMMTALPYGSDVFQPKPEQPAATYESFTRANHGEEARPLNMPNNIATADSSGYSFSGGKLDHLTYFVSVDVEQADLEDCVLEPLFDVWFAEAALAYGWVWTQDEPPPHAWDWPPKPIIDEVKTASARKIDLSTGVTHRRRVLAETGWDAEDEDQQAADDLGMDVTEYRRALFFAAIGTQVVDSSEGDDEGGKSQSSASGANGGNGAKAANGTAGRNRVNGVGPGRVLV